MKLKKSSKNKKLQKKAVKKVTTDKVKKYLKSERRLSIHRHSFCSLRDSADCDANILPSMFYTVLSIPQCWHERSNHRNKSSITISSVRVLCLGLFISVLSGTK